MLSKAYLEKISAQETLQLHAKTQTLNRVAQQIMTLQKYKSYLLMKDEFEPHEPKSVLSIFAPVNNSKCIQDAVTKLINRLNVGNTLEALLNMTDIENARKINAGFDGVINKLMEFSLLPPQDLQETSFHYSG